MINNIYRINRFKMPLFIVAGYIHFGSIYHIGFDFINNERIEAFNWFINQIYLTVKNHDIQLFKTVIFN